MATTKTKNRAQDGIGGPKLPFELICEIFTKAAEDDTPAALSLCRVSSAFNALISPVLYRTVALNSPRQIHKFLIRSTDTSKKHVRFLAIRQKYDIPVVSKVLSNFQVSGGHQETDFRKCLNVEHLALCTPYSDKDLRTLRPKYVHFGMKEDPSLYRPDFAFLSNVTHMRLWFVLYHTRQLVSLIDRFINITHIRIQLDHDSLFDRFRTEFPKDIAHILRLPYADGNIEDAPSYAVFDPHRVRTEQVYLTLGICPSRMYPERDVVREFVKAVEEDEVCRAALMSRPGSAQSALGSGSGEYDSDSSSNLGRDRPRLIVVPSKSVEEIRLKPKSWKSEMANLGEVF